MSQAGVEVQHGHDANSERPGPGGCAGRGRRGSTGQDAGLSDTSDSECGDGRRGSCGDERPSEWPACYPAEVSADPGGRGELRPAHMHRMRPAHPSGLPGAPWGRRAMRRLCDRSRGRHGIRLWTVAVVHSYGVHADSQCPVEVVSQLYRQRDHVAGKTGAQ